MDLRISSLLIVVTSLHEARLSHSKWVFTNALRENVRSCTKRIEVIVEELLADLRLATLLLLCDFHEVFGRFAEDFIKVLLLLVEAPLNLLVELLKQLLLSNLYFRADGTVIGRIAVNLLSLHDVLEDIKFGGGLLIFFRGFFPDQI